MNRLALLLCALSVALPAVADDEADKSRFGIGALPIVSYDADYGLGLGATSSLFWYDGETEPYKYRLDLLVFFTTSGVQTHGGLLNAVDVFDLPLRIEASAAWFSSVSANYCGVGNTVPCEDAEAEQRADQLGLSGQDRVDFVRRYFRARGIFPFLDVVARWSVEDAPLALTAGWRGGWYEAGQLGFEGFNFGPYPGSKYAQAFPLGENGLSSVFQLGAIWDHRDEEAWPRHGYYAETSLRGSSAFWGSAWTYAGVNLTLQGYQPLTQDRCWVLAGRLVLDGIAGDPHSVELGRTASRDSYSSFGGSWMGRGVRQSRAIGRIKAMQQIELRFDPWRWTLTGRELRLGGVSFVDAGWVGVDWDDFGGDPLHLVLGYGAGLRIVWDTNFVVRVDVGVSPDEAYLPRLYASVGNVF